MSLETGFLRDILDHPDDDTSRLVYADWLEDHGDEARAEFIRTQCRLAQMHRHDDDWPELDCRQAELLRQHGKRWGKAASKFTKRIEFIRGFVGKMTIAGEKFLREADRIFAACPLQQVRVLQPHVCFERLITSSALSRIRTLDLGSLRLGMNRVMALASSPQLVGLKDLDLASNGFRQRGLTALATSPHMRNLRSLGLHSNDLDNDSVNVLASSQTLTSLAKLDLSSNILGPAAADHLARSKNFRQLESLKLNYNNLGDDGVRLLLAGEWPRLRRLDLSYCKLRGGAITAIANCSQLTGLTELSLEGFEEPRWLRELAESPHLTNLRVLNLAYWPAGSDDDIRALTGAAFLPRLRELSLPYLSDAGFRLILQAPALGDLFRLVITSGRSLCAQLGNELAAATHLRQLRYLDLRFSDLGAVGMKKLANSPHLANLTYLGLTHSRLDTEAFRALIESPYLNRLQRLDLRGNYPGPNDHMVEALRDRFGEGVCLF